MLHAVQRLLEAAECEVSSTTISRRRRPSVACAADLAAEVQAERLHVVRALDLRDPLGDDSCQDV